MIGIGWFNFPCPGALPRFFADPQDPQRLGRPHSPRHRSIVTLRGRGLPGPHRWAASITDGTDPGFVGKRWVLPYENQMKSIETWGLDGFTKGFTI